MIRFNQLTISQVKDQGFYLTVDRDVGDHTEPVDEGIALDMDMLIEKVKSWAQNKEL